MKENIGIEQTSQMVQRLSPRQVQFVRLLEMSAPEIEDEVQRQLDDNPALEVAESADTPDDNTPSSDEVIEARERDPEDDIPDYDDGYGYNGSQSAYSGSGAGPADDAPDLNTYLNSQLGEMEMPELKRSIAAYIIGNIDENGYLTRTFGQMADDIAIATGLDITRDDVVAAAEVVRGLDPAGVGAVDLRDCLLLQIARIRPVDFTARVARETVESNFDLLSKKHYDRLQSQLGVTPEQMRAALSLIQGLNPKPGSGIAPAQSSIRFSQISPDVSVESTDDGRFIVSLVSSLPRLQIERSFSVDDSADAAEPDSRNERLNAGRRSSKAFIKLKRDDAEAFISALKQRSDTLLAVTEAIVKKQKEFFESGDKASLHPMILKDIAAVTGLDISVISRATAGKYVTTATGTYPLKMFFSESPKDNSDASLHKILDVMQKVIDNEDKKHPMSDEAIRTAMSQNGYDLARRTVTKYREKLGIPVARLRKGL